MKQENNLIKVVIKFISINKGTNFTNIVVENIAHEQFSVSTDSDTISLLKVGKLYEIEYSNETKESLSQVSKVKEYKELHKFTPLEDLKGIDLAYYYDIFFKFAPKKILEIRQEIETYLSRIQNKILSDITKVIYNKYYDRFYTHPAATVFHHAYYGGLSYHTYSMLKLADAMIDEYPYLNRDLMYAGIILHDILKVEEITGVDGSYTLQGTLIGHLISGAMEIKVTSKALGYDDSEEALMLEHIVISHHGQFTFGSHKKPQIAEGLMIWYIDTIDAKFRVIGEELSKTRIGEFTQQINVADKIAFYRHKIK
ncbi:MAG: HD domain-containing protein [Acholeplasmatales bacterium]|jgi:3'-5' exoribonuclease|nr:HD domain-containing protein [Acholeplasmatales bacterium]